MLHIRLASIPQKDKHTIDSVMFDARSMVATLQNPNLKVQRTKRPNNTVDVYLIDVAAKSQSKRANRYS